MKNNRIVFSIKNIQLKKKEETYIVIIQDRSIIEEIFLIFTISDIFRREK